MRFATYGRKSVYSDKSDSVDNQERMCREYADFRFKGQVESFEAYSDEGLSGANTDRPGLKRLLSDVDDGCIDALIVYQLDRIWNHYVFCQAVHAGNWQKRHWCLCFLHCGGTGEAVS